MIKLIKAGQGKARSDRAEGLVEADRGVARDGLPELRPQQRHHQAAVRAGEAVRSDQGRRLSSPPTSASTRCGRRSSTSSTSRAAGSTPAAWAPWASACRPRWACSWPSRKRRSPASPAKRSIQMCIQELSTCKQYRICRSRSSTLNNRYLGMVRQWQEFFYGNRYSESYMDALPDFVKLAEAYGHVGMRIDKPGRRGRRARRRRSRRNEGSSGVPGLPSPTRPRTSIRWFRAARACPK